MSDVPRYDIETDTRDSNTVETRCTEGEWVKYSDHEASVAELEASLAASKAREDAYRAEVVRITPLATELMYAVEEMAKSIVESARDDMLRRGYRCSILEDYIPDAALNNPIARAAIEAAKGEVK